MKNLVSALLDLNDPHILDISAEWIEDILVDQGNNEVRLEVAKQGRSLPVLVKDEYWLVRAEVAQKGIGLGTLVHDEDVRVRQVVHGYLAENTLGIISK